MGTLGFLTPFESADAAATLERVLAADQAPVFCTLRTRRRCEVVWCGRGVRLSVQNLGYSLHQVRRSSSVRCARAAAARWSGAIGPDPYPIFQHAAHAPPLPGGLVRHGALHKSVLTPDWHLGF